MLRRMQDRTRRSTSKNLRDERGAVAVEFALIFGILAMILFGIIEFGLFFSRYQMLHGAAREGARLAAVRGTEAEVDARVIDAAEPYEVNAVSGIQVSVDGGNGVDTPCDKDTRGQRVEVSWDQNFQDAIVLPFIPDISITTEVSGVFRCE
jgi:hypothetical protein